MANKYIENFFDRFTKAPTVKAPLSKPTTEPSEKINVKVLPAQSRSSSPNEAMYGMLEKDAALVKPGYQFEVIPFIRKLTISNPDVSQALHNIVQLGNTGVKMEFDSKVTPDQASKMRKHIDTVSKTWVDGAPGLHSICNKLFRQLMIAGANSIEAVPNSSLNGVYKLLLVKPESIRIKYRKSKLSYEYYQHIENSSLLLNYPTVIDGLVPLNPYTFRYFAMNGDTEVPYANPPYLPSLGPIEDQKIMLENIKFIIRQLGVVGFMELLLDKPAQLDGEGLEKYQARLDKFLSDAKSRVQNAMREGVVVGFNEDHTFEFQSVSKNLSGVETLFGINETQVAAGVKSDPGLMGKGSAGAESHITIIFTKLIAELKNIQLIVAMTLEFVINMELRLAGYDYENLCVEFNPSTVQDDLKLQQAFEIKIRNYKALYDDGIISQDQYANAVGEYEKAFLPKPRIERTIKGQTGDPSAIAAQKKKREVGKDKSAVEQRKKAKPQDKKQYK